MKVYLDNAATSFPKPPEVADAVYNFLVNNGSNAGRGSYGSSLDNSRTIYECREALCKLFNFDKPENVIFMPSITYSLNVLLLSLLKPNWHVITSTMDHNSVLRPLSYAKESLGIELDIVEASKEGFISPKDIESCIKPNTKLVVLSHSSNIVGSIQPLEEIGALCKKHNIFFIIDAAQSAGIIPVDFKALNADAIAFTGHKGLMGPQGIGGFIISDDLNQISRPVVLGGTGSLSSSLTQPDFLPDKFESGTQNAPGIYGLNAALQFIASTSKDAIYQKEKSLMELLVEGLSLNDQVIIHGHKDLNMRTSVLSVIFKDFDTSEIAYLLDKDYNIMCRAGLHCAPLAHKTIGTYPSGTIRFSPGYFTTKEEITYTVDALNKLLRR